MKRLFHPALCLPALVLMTTLSAHSAPAEPAPLRVLCFGDSITEGGALPKADWASLWLTLVEKNSDGKVKPINEGKGGRPTDSVKEFEAAFKKHEGAFDMLFIMLGTNDSRDISETCVPKATANVRKMIELARAKMPGLRVLLAGPPNINKNALGPTKPIANEREQKLKDLNEAFKQLATEAKCEFVSLFGTVPDSSLLKDGVHPDAKGNEALAEVIGKALAQK